MSELNKKNKSHNIDDLSSSQCEEELINDSELTEAIEELELSPKDLDEIAGGVQSQCAPPGLE